MSRFLAFAALALTAAAPALAAPGQAPRWAGTWANGSDSVHIRTAPCGQGVCGTVIWANEKAKADAARGGTTQLIGTQILRDFQPDGQGGWTGQAFVPDANVTVAGTMAMTSADTMDVSGCLFGQLGCTTQHWHRVR